MGLHREGIKLVEETSRILELLGDVVGEAVCLIHLAFVVCCSDAQTRYMG